MHLADYTPAEIAEIAVVKMQHKDPPVPLEDGLLEALATHVDEKHAHEISQHNAGLAVNLVEVALGVRAQRIHKMIQDEIETGDVNAIPVLKVDFGMCVLLQHLQCVVWPVDLTVD